LLNLNSRRLYVRGEVVRLTSAICGVLGLSGSVARAFVRPYRYEHPRINFCHGDEKSAPKRKPWLTHRRADVIRDGLTHEVYGTLKPHALAFAYLSGWFLKLLHVYEHEAPRVFGHLSNVDLVAFCCRGACPVSIATKPMNPLHACVDFQAKRNALEKVNGYTGEVESTGSGPETADLEASRSRSRASRQRSSSNGAPGAAKLQASPSRNASPAARRRRSLAAAAKRSGAAAGPIGLSARGLSRHERATAVAFASTQKQQQQRPPRGGSSGGLRVGAARRSSRPGSPLWSPSKSSPSPPGSPRHTCHDSGGSPSPPPALRRRQPSAGGASAASPPSPGDLRRRASGGGGTVSFGPAVAADGAEVRWDGTLARRPSSRGNRSCGGGGGGSEEDEESEEDLASIELGGCTWSDEVWLGGASYGHAQHSVPAPSGFGPAGGGGGKSGGPPASPLRPLHQGLLGPAAVAAAASSAAAAAQQKSRALVVVRGAGSGDASATLVAGFSSGMRGNVGCRMNLYEAFCFLVIFLKSWCALTDRCHKKVGGGNDPLDVGDGWGWRRGATPTPTANPEGLRRSVVRSRASTHEQWTVWTAASQAHALAFAYVDRSTAQRFTCRAHVARVLVRLSSFALDVTGSRVSPLSQKPEPGSDSCSQPNYTRDNSNGCFVCVCPACADGKVCGPRQG